MTVRGIGSAERRARLAVRHHLAPGATATRVPEVADGLVAVHATDAASAYLAASTRMDLAPVAAVERALYDDRSVVRMLGMRRTVFLVPRELVPVVHAACTRTVAERERRKLVRMLEQAGIASAGDGWLRGVEDRALAALTARGEATATELAADVPELGRRIVLAAGKAYQGSQSVASRVLFLLAADGLVVRARPLGSWVSSQYRWAPAESWLPGGVNDPAGLTTEAAQGELARRWLRAYGPAPAGDLRWWAGWTVTETRRAIAGTGAVEVALDSGTAYMLPDDLDPVPAPEPWVALLPGLDPTVMGWSERAWFLGPHRDALFDRSGNAGPTVWVDGRVVGGWSQRGGGEVAYRLLEDVGAETETAVTKAADRLTGWFAGTRVTPRFRTPLERELSN